MEKDAACYVMMSFLATVTAKIAAISRMLYVMETNLNLSAREFVTIR